MWAVLSQVPYMNTDMTSHPQASTFALHQTQSAGPELEGWQWGLFAGAVAIK